MGKYFKRPFAENGEITQIPNNDQGDGNVSYENGWPEGYEIDPTQDPDEARNLSRTNFNGLFFNITEALQTLQQYGCNPYITASDNDGELFAYPEGGCCYYTDPTTNEVGVYRSLQSNNTDIPSTNGITSPLWRREFDVQLDTLKSNRVSNCVLYYSSFPSYVTDSETDTITISVAAGTKVLLGNGIDSTDGTLNNKIFQLTNTEEVSYTFEEIQVNKFIFITENNELLLLDTKNYNQNTSYEMVENQLEGTTDYDIYYFDSDKNKWQYRQANSENFVDLSYSMVNVCSFTGSSIDNISFSYIDPLMIISSETFNRKMDNVQPALTTARYITLSNTNDGKQIIDINLPTTATPFCVNSGNLNGSGNPDLMWTDSVVRPNAKEDMVSPNKGNITSYRPTYYRTVRGRQVAYLAPQAFSANNINNIFVPNGGVCDVYFAYNYGNTVEYVVADMTLNSPITLSTLGCTLSTSFYQFYEYHHWVGYELWYAQTWFIIQLFFNDNSSVTYDTRNYAGNNSWATLSVNLGSYATAGKKITRIKVSVQGYMYNHCYGSYQWWYSVWSHIKAIRIINNVNQIEYSSNKIFFKVGSNYYDLLGENATPLITATNGEISSAPSIMNSMWLETNIARIPSYVDGFATVFSFNETPAETNNARLVMRYKDVHNNQFLGGLNIELEYWGGATYKLLEGKKLYESQDLILAIPDGKYIKSVKIYADSTDFLNEVYIGQVQIYNDVPSATLSALNQYPTLQFTSADTDRSHFTLMNIDPIITDDSGYVMVSKAGAYILPATNVIRKQKARPTLASDPALREGDIWLDYSKEPLIAYQYNKGQWEITKDVPIGFVQLLWSDPSASASVDGTGITAASVTTNTFAQAVAGTGVYIFIYDGTGWFLSGNPISLSDYGISITGTPVLDDKVIVTFTASSASVQTLTSYDYNQNGYDVNAFTSISGALVGRDGRDGAPGKDGKNGAPGAKGDPGIGIPSGGTTGQLLAKASNASYDTKWTTMASSALFDGGTAGQIIVKNSSDDLDFSWSDMPSGIPNGGNTGEALIKASNTDKDVTWGTIQSLPTGGNPGYVLTKRTGSNYDVVWSDPSGRLAIYDNDTSFMLGCYVYAQQNSYSAVAIENFHNASGIDDTAADGAAVISVYYSSMTMAVTNSSNSSIIFWLKPISSANPLHSLVPHWEKTGTVNLSISFDNGTTFSALTDYEPFAMNNQTDFIIKVSMSSGAVIKNIALITK